MSGEYGVLPAIRGNRFSRCLLRGWSRRHLQRQIKDPLLLEKLRPDYPIGAKRILFSDNYYPTLERDNVTLVTENIQSFSKQGLLLENGDSKQFDVIIYATGFKTNPFLSSIEISGIDEQLLSNAWRDGAHAYLGVATHGFPNLHMMYGPNTNLGHSSIIIMLEAQANYIVQSIVELDCRSQQSIEINQASEQQYNQEIQSRLQKMAFNEIDESWYKDGGKITNNWAGGTVEYSRRMKNIDWTAYTLK
jgi:cation diffusion facilitator CzcD-associated flavoprotein CzcO